MRIPPKEIKATWPAPNFVDPDTRGPDLIIVELTILPLAALVLALRLYVRIGMLHKSGWDDWLMVGAAVFGTGVTVCVILASTLFGWDKHVWDLALDDMISGRKVSMAAQALFVFATTLAKVSILLSYLRFAPVDSMLRRASIWASVIIVVSNVIFLTVLFTQCTPTSSYWNIMRTHLDCIAEGPPLMVQAVITVLADFTVWILPLPTFLRAQLPMSQRIALTVLFSFGLFVVFGACMRTYWIWYVVEATYDVTWEGFHLWIWTAVEVHLGIICGCIPTLKGLIRPHNGTSRSGSKPVYAAGSGLGLKDGGPPIQLAEQKPAPTATTTPTAGNQTLGAGEGKQMGTAQTDQYMDLESCCSDMTVNARRSRRG